MWLPNIDPAGSPRVGGPSPRGRATHQNPHVPSGAPFRSTGAQSARGRLQEGAQISSCSHDDAAVPSLKVRPPAGDRISHHPDGASPRTMMARSASASVGATPRSAMSEAALRAAQAKRLERLHDSYQTALSRETLQSEQFDKELIHVRERLLKIQHNQPERGAAVQQKATRTRGKLERRVSGFESKLNELETYNAKLVEMISALRKQNEPHRQATKLNSVRLEKLNLDMQTQKAAVHKALDERERCVDQMKHLQEDSTRDASDFEAAVEALRRDSEELDAANREQERVIETAMERTRRQQCKAMRVARRDKEKLEVRYGYLRSQLEGVDADFRELQRIVGVHFQPSHPESLQQIIDKFVEKERRVASLQQYASLQQDELSALENKLTALSRDEAAAEASRAEEAAAADAAAGKAAQPSPWEDGEMLEQLMQRFSDACGHLEGMFSVSGCELATAEGAHLATKGCSSSTIHDFLAAISQRLDDIHRKAQGLQAAATSTRVSRKTNDPFEGFLRPRGPPAGASSDAPSASEGGAAPGAAPGPAPRSYPDARENLPSIADPSPGDFEGDEPARREKAPSKKGTIDRGKRDAAIAAWVQKQQQIRGAQTARPAIREFYDDEGTSFPPHPIYPPASAR